MAKNPFNVLTSFQMDVLGALRVEPVLKDFYLTGGTALAGFFLGHRLSEDLDFFTELESGVSRIPPVIQKVSRKLKAHVSLGRRFETLFECSLFSNRAVVHISHLAAPDRTFKRMCYVNNGTVTRTR